MPDSPVARLDPAVAAEFSQDPDRPHATDGSPCWCGAVPVDPLAGQRAERLQVEVDLETLRKVREAWAECEQSLSDSPDSEPVWDLLRSLRSLLS